MQSLIPAWDTCFWQQSPYICAINYNSYYGNKSLSDVSMSILTAMCVLQCMKFIRHFTSVVWQFVNLSAQYDLVGTIYCVIFWITEHLRFSNTFSTPYPICNWSFLWGRLLLLMPCYLAPGLSQQFNSLRPRQNGRHFADDIFKRIFFNENIWIPIKISLKFVPKGSINNIPALVQIMAWRRPGDTPLSEPMMVNLPTHICVTRPQWVKQWPLLRAQSKPRVEKSSRCTAVLDEHTKDYFTLT